MVDTVEAMVEGGKATAGPPLGPALGPKGVNIGQIVAAINEKTKAFAGMKSNLFPSVIAARTGSPVRTVFTSFR